MLQPGLAAVYQTTHQLMYTVFQKNVPPLVCYNFDTREHILIFFGRNVTNIGKQSKGALLCHLK